MKNEHILYYRLDKYNNLKNRLNYLDCKNLIKFL